MMKKMHVVRTKLNKKALTLAGVMLILAGAVVANILITQKNGSEDAVAASASADGDAAAASTQLSFFESFRNERDSTRSQEIAYIDTIIEQGADAETMADAQQQKMDIVDAMEKEMTVESLIKAKGFTDVAVTLHAGSVNVVIASESLTDEQVAQVLDIVVRETGEKAENIKVTTAQ